MLAGNGYAGLSDLGMYAIGGLLKHAPALCAFANPTTNSYKRLVAGFEAPTKLSYSRRNRTAVIRIPIHSPNPRSRRIEFRCPDSAANPYLLFSAMLMAALDGIQNKTRPGDPLDKDIYDLQPDELEDVPTTPRTLEASLDALRADSDFLLRGDVFTPDVIDTWIWYKRTHEVEALCGRPHPYEFCSITTSECGRRARCREALRPAGERVTFGFERCRGGLVTGGIRLLGPEGEQDQHGAGDEHVVGEIEDRAVETDRIDVEVDEVADAAEHEAVVAIAQRSGHDQPERGRQPAVAGGPLDEEIPANHHGGHHRERREDQAAVLEVAAQSPEGSPVQTGVQLEDVRDQGDRGGGGWADPGEDERLRDQVECGPSERDGPEQDPTRNGHFLVHPRLSRSRAH